MNPVSRGALKEKGTPYRQKKEDKNYKRFFITVRQARRAWGKIIMVLKEKNLSI